VVTEKGDKKIPAIIPFIYFLSLFYGEKTKPQEIAKSRKGSQIGAGQGREGLDNTCTYAWTIMPTIIPPECADRNQSKKVKRRGLRGGF